MSSRHGKRKYLSAKPTLAGVANRFNLDATINPAFAPANYWKIISERSQSALRNALIENEKLQKSVKYLKQQNGSLKVMLNEVDGFLEVIEEKFHKIEAHLDIRYDKDDVAGDDGVVEVNGNPPIDNGKEKEEAEVAP